MFKAWILTLGAALAGVHAGCDEKNPDPAPGSKHDDHAAHAPHAAPAAELPPGNVVQTEMRMMTSILEGAVRAIGARDVRSIEHELHRLHGAKDATTAAVRDGSYKLPRNADQVDAFLAMDEAFHADLAALVMASRKNDVPAAADALGKIMRGCEGCHATFRESVAIESVPADPAPHHEH